MGRRRGRGGLAALLRLRPEPVRPRPPGSEPAQSQVEPEPEREIVQARVAPEAPPAGEALDRLAAAVFDGPAGQARLAPLIDRYAEQVGSFEVDDAEYELLQVQRMDWALCDAPADDARHPGDTWAWRALQGELPELGLEPTPSLEAAARSLAGLFEVYPGEPTWVRDRISGLVLRVFDSVGPWPGADPSRPAALWEMRLIPAQVGGGFFLARAPIDYPDDLLEALEGEFTRRFASERWPSMQDLRRARLRFVRAGGRTPIERMLQWR